MSTTGSSVPNVTEEDRIVLFKLEMDGIVDEKVFEWLKQNGFFRQVASTRFHGAYEGGLFDHSYAVMKNLLFLTQRLGLEWQRPQSPKIIGMFHDLCKIDQYVKTAAGWTFRWTKLAGHGDKSVIMLKTLIETTEEEDMCIVQHMGAFVDKTFWNAYTEAVKKYPNVLFTHTADMMASNIDNV